MMNREQIIAMAQEAGISIAADSNVIGFYECMERFANLVAAHEREKFCAVLRQLHDSYSLQSDPSGLRARGTT